MADKTVGLYPTGDDPHGWLPGVPYAPHNQTEPDIAKALVASGLYRVGELVPEPTPPVVTPEPEPEPVKSEREPYWWAPSENPANQPQAPAQPKRTAKTAATVAESAPAAETPPAPEGA